MPRPFNQAAHAAVRTKDGIFEVVYRRLVVRLGHAQAMGVIAHGPHQLVWKILHDGVELRRARSGGYQCPGALAGRVKMVSEPRNLDTVSKLAPAPSGGA